MGDGGIIILIEVDIEQIKIRVRFLECWSVVGRGYLGKYGTGGY
jgi:hypothetical protein